MRVRCDMACWHLIAVVASCIFVASFGCSSAESQGNHSAGSRPIQSARKKGDDARPGGSIAVETNDSVLIERGVDIETDGGTVHVANALKLRGEQGEAIRDTETGRLAWPARTCRNPACPGRGVDGGPFLFTHSVSTDAIDSQGYVQLDRPIPQSQRIMRCPACGQSDSVVEYVLPEVVRRRAELDAELSEVRAAIRAAGGQLPDGMRPPLEIMHERALQPRLYLVPE